MSRRRNAAWGWRRRFRLGGVVGSGFFVLRKTKPSPIRRWLRHFRRLAMTPPLDINRYSPSSPTTYFWYAKRSGGAKPACAGESGVITQQPYVESYRRPDVHSLLKRTMQRRMSDCPAAINRQVLPGNVRCLVRRKKENSSSNFVGATHATEHCHIAPEAHY